MSGDVKDGPDHTLEHVKGPPAAPSLGKGVFKTHICEGAAYHDLVVAPSAAVAVEVLLSHAAGAQVACRRCVGDDGPRRRYMIGRDEVPEQCEGARALDLDDVTLSCDLEVGSATDVGRGLIPGKGG